RGGCGCARRGAGDHHPRARRRSDRGVRRRHGVADPPDSARGTANDVRPRIPRRARSDRGNTVRDVIAPARIAAYETVLAVASGRADLPSALAHARRRLTDDRDRALAGEIAAGAIRWQGATDHLVREFSGRAPAKLDAEILAILRIGVFQLLHLDRVPAS